MWLKLDLDGAKFNLNMSNYKPNTKREDEYNAYTKTKLKVKWGNTIDYTQSDEEIIESYEVDELISKLDDLINDRIKEEELFTFEIGELSFMMYPKLPESAYIIDDYNIPIEENDIYMELNVYLVIFDKIADVKFTLPFERKEIEALYYYLCLISNKLDSNDEHIKKLIEEKVIYGK